jgi:hypothetical protein
MKFQLSVVGCDCDYGEKVTIFEDEQVGEISIREITVDSIAELTRILDEENTDAVQLSKSRWERYDGKITIF